MTFPRWLAALLLTASCVASHAQGSLLKLPTRPGISTNVWWEPVDGARATVLLFPGGGGGFGRVDGGQPSSQNFLVRSLQFFRSAGLNVAIFGKPGDIPELDVAERTGAAHLADVSAVVDELRRRSPLPLWLVGTSRGTVSATAAAIGLPPGRIAGVVLSSSLVNLDRPGALMQQDLAALVLPVLVVHHAKDACVLCRPADVPYLLRSLKNTPVKKLLMLDGGADPRGAVCDALHWHGFIGMEKEAVDAIAAWIAAPSN